MVGKDFPWILAILAPMNDGRMFCALLGVVAAAAAQKCRCVNARFEMIVCVWVDFWSGFGAEMYR
jgi:hypothetical protein